MADADLTYELSHPDLVWLVLDGEPIRRGTRLHDATGVDVPHRFQTPPSRSWRATARGECAASPGSARSGAKT
jgi:hypothetical protein